MRLEEVVLILHCVAQALPVSHVERVEEQRIHVWVSGEGHFQRISKLETEKYEESLDHDHVVGDCLDTDCSWLVLEADWVLWSVSMSHYNYSSLSTVNTRPADICSAPLSALPDTRPGHNKPNTSQSDIAKWDHFLIFWYSSVFPSNNLLQRCKDMYPSHVAEISPQENGRLSDSSSVSGRRDYQLYEE